jgi:hypothetical protein
MMFRKLIGKFKTELVFVAQLRLIYTSHVGPVILLSNDISIQVFPSFQNCHCQRQGQVFTVCSPVKTPLK